jgi:hypothetical protein
MHTPSSEVRMAGMLYPHVNELNGMIKEMNEMSGAHTLVGLRLRCQCSVGLMSVPHQTGLQADTWSVHHSIEHSDKVIRTYGLRIIVYSTLIK